MSKWSLGMTEGMNARKRPDIGDEWYAALHDQFEAPYFADLRAFLIAERATKTIYPRGNDIFKAFKSTPLDRVRVVILGQDPYHGPGQAHGLCFSVPRGMPHPPSLQNIFSEINRELSIPVPLDGDLSPWADQGVLLLNATLTVRQGEAGSHQGKGWERFTDAAIAAVSAHRNGVVFLLWGRFAQEKSALIDGKRHYILKAPHPSPLSAHRGFFGCGHFEHTNTLLVAQGGPPIDWST